MIPYTLLLSSDWNIVNMVSALIHKSKEPSMEIRVMSWNWRGPLQITEITTTSAVGLMHFSVQN